MLKTKIVASKDREEHEKKLNDFFEKAGKINKPIMVHKIIRSKGSNMSFLTYIHYEVIK